MNVAFLHELPKGTMLGEWGNRVWTLVKRTFSGKYLVEGRNGFGTVKRTYSAFELHQLMSAQHVTIPTYSPKSHVDLVKNVRRIPVKGRYV